MGNGMQENWREFPGAVFEDFEFRGAGFKPHIGTRGKGRGLKERGREREGVLDPLKAGKYGDRSLSGPGSQAEREITNSSRTPPFLWMSPLHVYKCHRKMGAPLCPQIYPPLDRHIYVPLVTDVTQKGRLMNTRLCIGSLFPSHLSSSLPQGSSSGHGYSSW